MKIHSLRLRNIRCFEDTGDLLFSPRLNILVGHNNSGKSTILKAIFGLQSNPFDNNHVRPSRFDDKSFSTVVIVESKPTDYLNFPKATPQPAYRLLSTYRGHAETTFSGDYTLVNISTNNNSTVFSELRPNHSIVLFLAARKAQAYNHAVSSGVQDRVSGTFVNLFSRIDQLATWGHPKHDKFREAIERIVGLQITMRASPQGKVAGFYFDSATFVTLDRMGDGVSEMVALIVELCLEEQKIFVLEEPETNLHPSGLKALLELLRDPASKNQFFISTHSNVVLRELGGVEDTKIFQVYLDSKAGNSASVIAEIEKSPQAHLAILRDLGYEFLDYNLYEGWLFLEESSAETVIAEILIPSFVPELRSKIRT